LKNDALDRAEKIEKAVLWHDRSRDRLRRVACTFGDTDAEYNVKEKEVVLDHDEEIRINVQPLGWAGQVNRPTSSWRAE